MAYRSLKVIETGFIRELGWGFLFAFYSNYGRICSRLWDDKEWRDLENQSFKVIKNGAVR